MLVSLYLKTFIMKVTLDLTARQNGTQQFVVEQPPEHQFQE